MRCDPKSTWIASAVVVATAGMVLKWLSALPTSFALDENCQPPGLRAWASSSVDSEEFRRPQLAAAAQVGTKCELEIARQWAFHRTSSGSYIGRRLTFAEDLGHDDAS
jgi:hypothetical protein